MKSHSRVISPKGKYKFEFEQALKNAGGRCQAFPKWKDGPTSVRCTAKATEVLDEVSTDETAARTVSHKYIAVCTQCRIAGTGSTPAERGARTKDLNKRQGALFS